ncbi:MAG: replicative DNA helicase [Thermincolia bacterium]
MQTPHNLEAEQGLIASAILDPNCIDEININSDDFYHPKHQAIWSVIIELHANLKHINLINLTDRLPELTTDIARMTNLVPTATGAQSYADVVRTKSKLRQIITAGKKIQRLPFTDFDNVDELINQVEKQVYDLSNQRTSNDILKADAVLQEYDRMVNEANKRGNGLTGLDTGFFKLNYKTSGLQKQDLIIIGARPSMGKTALMLNLANHISVKQENPTLIFSLEQSRTKLIQRMIASLGSVDSQKLKLCNLTNEESVRFTDSYGQIHKAPLYIDDTPGISVMEILSKCRRVKRKHGLDAVIIDYLGLMKIQKGLGRYEGVSENTRVLKNIARELDVPVVCLSQLSRDVEKRDDKRPMLSDLRETGEIEQTADMVWFLYRDEYYKKNSNDKGLAELIIAKQRDGPTGTVKLKWFEQFTRFENLSPYAEMGQVIEGGWPGDRNTAQPKQG